MGLGHSPSIIVDGLIFHIDPNNPRCYSGSGNTIYNLVNPSIGGTFVGFTANPIDNTETRSIFFDGTNDYIDFGSSSSLKLTDNFTLSAWVKSNVYGDRAILGNFGPSSNYSGFNFNVQPSGKFAFLTGSHPNATYLYADNTYNLNTWYHITGVRRNGTNYLYINGIAQTSTNTQIVATSAQNFYFGKWYSNLTDYYHSGQIGIVSLYNRALTASEILQNYNAKRKKFYPEENIVSDGLVLHIDPSKNTSYPGTGNTIYDLSGSGNTGTLSAGLTFSGLNGGSIVNDAGNKVLSYQSANFSTNNFTMEAWVSVKSYPGTNAVFISNRGTNDNGWLLDVTFNKKGRIFIQRDAGAFYSLETINDLGLNKWTNLSVVRNTTNLYLYRDGVLQNSTNLPSNYDIQSAYANDYVTRYFGANGALDGNISTIKYYNRALTLQEVQQNYNATKKRFVNALPPVSNGLIFELDAVNRSSYIGTGNTWYDLSGSNYHATLTNGPTFSGFGNTSNLVLDGTNDFLISDVNKTIIGSSFTISFLFSTSSSSGGLLEISDSQGSSFPWIYLKRESSSQIYWYLDGNYRLLVSLAVNENALMSITYSNTLWSMFKNGVLQGTSAIGLGSYGGNNLRLGVGYHGNTATKWNLFTINNRALSAYEIKQNFDYYRTRYNI